MAVTTDVEKSIQLFLQMASQKVRIIKAYIFGSSARGKRHKWSDIDLAIVSPDFSGDKFEDSKIFFPIILQVNRSIEVHPFRPEEFTPDNPFVEEILKTGIRVI